MAVLVTIKAEKLLRDEMCICLDDLQNHLISTAHVELGSAEYFENDEFWNKEILDFSDNRGIKTDTQEYFTVDSIRHALISFKSGGLYSLYKNRQAENWYPKVVIRTNLGANNLVGDVVIYRGTSKSELESGRFSQSWTLKEDVACEFAFKHYDGQEDYVNTERVVLKARINVRHIYYYDEADNEQEVIIDEREIIDGPAIVSQSAL
jgi:hypothetical protein